MRVHNDWISDMFATQLPDTGVKRCENLSRDKQLEVQMRGLGTDRVLVTPVSRTFWTWAITSLTGSTGGLQDMKTTVITLGSATRRKNEEHTTRSVRQAVSCASH